MDIKEVLSEIGLSHGEISVYLALLKLGSSPVSKIKEESELHRTTIYDFVEKLLNKGLINYVVRNNVKHYNATDPEKIVEFLKEKLEHINTVLPELRKLKQFQKEEIKVEVYKGKEGLKTVMLECLRLGKEVVGMGIDDALFKEALPTFIEQYQRELRERNIHERILTTINATYLFNQKQTHYKFLPENYFSPTSTLIYGDKVQIVIWKPSLTTVMIENKDMADSYRKHFEVLWKQESLVFRGIQEVEALFHRIAETIPNNGEYLAFGVPPIADQYANLFLPVMEKMSKKKIKQRVIFDERALKQIANCKKFPLVQTKTMAVEHMSPAETNIFRDNIAIILWGKTPQGFLIKNKEIADSFRKYFEVMWGIAT
ncbi:MAG: helix-turn-helix domain-containing protein [Nanoarchaeota archaeon]|mgnify:CR=1 FL=1